MRRIPLAVFALLLIAAAVYVVNTSGQLPLRVASHFGTDHRANGVVPRTFYLGFMLGFATLLPIVMVAAIATLPRILSRSQTLSRRAGGNVFVRCDAALAVLADHAPWLGSLLSAFIVGMHYAILEANTPMPSRLPGDVFLALMAGFLGLLAVWVFALRARLRRAH
jgi:hypothetical protein